MRQRIKQVHLILGLVEFRNINLVAKGCYQLKIQAFTSNQSLTLAYYSHEDLQQEKLQLRQNYSTKVQYNSDDEKSNKKQQNKNLQQQSNKNTYHSLPFFVKYHCQRVKLKSIALFTKTTTQEMIQIKVTLLRKQMKNINDQQLHEIQHVQFTINCTEHYLQQKQILFPSPQCCSFKLAILSCPLLFYDQIYSCSSDLVKSIKTKKSEDKKQLLLQQIRKMVKKQRYETFILKRQLCDVLINPIDQPIKLPLHFIQKENMSMDEVETNQLKFFKYLAFYQRYYTSAQMLKEQMQHINFDKITIIKNFIDQFQRSNLILTVLQQKQKVSVQKKFKNFLITTQNSYPLDKIFGKYSNEQMKSKKGKIKQIDSIILNGNCNDHVFQNGFVIEKQTKKQLNNERFFIKYPLVFRDILSIQKENIQRSDTVMVCVLTKKVRKKKKYFIFAHGFQGLPIDLSFLINMIRFSNEKIKTFVLKSYKNHMGESIESMASRAAQEIEGIFKKIDLNEIQPEITFIGHSMGPIIIRAAFKHLAHLNEYFDSFISICAPHLGYIQGTKFLTEAGLSILSKLKPIESLSQLSNRDNSDLEKTFIYKLSKQGSLKYFKKILLIASMQDDYVPWHSARIEPFLQKGNKEKIQRDMISHIFGINSKQTKIQRIQRIEISFPHEKEKSLNSLIGRTCHIKPLSDRGFLQILTRQLLSY